MDVCSHSMLSMGPCHHVLWHTLVHHLPEEVVDACAQVVCVFRWCAAAINNVLGLASYPEAIAAQPGCAST